MIVEVCFRFHHFSSFFRSKDLNLKKNITVLVDSEYGVLFGKVVQIVSDVSQFDGVDLYEVKRVASKKDYLHYLDNCKLEKDAVSKCREMVQLSGLSMNILDGYYNFDRSLLLFRFVADERVDFRQLARDLGTTFRVRIELRQIGIRDKAKEIGGIGPCGRLLCCSSFLSSFDSVTISMAKNQNVSLNPSKINGVCGRLLCCLKYENDLYSSFRKDLPKVGDIVELEDGKGKVVSVDLLKRTFVVELDNQKRVEVVDWVAG